MKTQYCHFIRYMLIWVLLAIFVLGCASSEQSNSAVEAISSIANSTHDPSGYDQQSFDLIAVMVGFLLGILSGFIRDAILRRREKIGLIAVFMADISRNWMEIDRTGMHPRSIQGARIVSGFKGVKDTKFYRDPEYEYEVHNLKLYETEGFRIVQYLQNRTRIKFWDVYTLLRNAEATRQIIKSLDEDATDREAYREVFTSLVSQFADEMGELWNLLYSERGWFFNLRQAIFKSD